MLFLFIVLFLLWVLFSGGISVQTALTGAIVCVLITLFCAKFMRRRTSAPVRFGKRFVKGLAYLVVLVREIFLSALGVLKYIYGKKEPRANLVHFQSELDTDGLQVLVANSITLTPGTITVDVKDGEYTVHGLDVSMTDDIENSCFFRRANDMKGI